MSSLSIENRIAEMIRVESWWGELAKEQNWPDRTRFALDMILNESLTNIINYGYPEGGTHQIELVLEGQGDKVELQITDDAIPFNPLEAPEPPPVTDLESVAIGGRGILLMKKYSDEISYSRSGDHNVLKVTLLTQ